MTTNTPSDPMTRTWHANERLPICAATIGVTEAGTAFPIRCKSWNCETCAAINSRLHAVKCANGVYAMIHAGIRPKFITLTLPAGARTPEWAFSKLADMWDKMRNRLQYSARKIKIPVWYSAFVETHKSGLPHFHIITSYAPTKYVLKNMAVASGMGYKVDVSPVRNKAGVAWYISKYGSKSQGKMGLPKGFRRVRYSEGFPDMLFDIETREKGMAMLKHPSETIVEFGDRVLAIMGRQAYDSVWQIVGALTTEGFDTLTKYERNSLIFNPTMWDDQDLTNAAQGGENLVVSLVD